jgi:hypothetical protein
MRVPVIPSLACTKPALSLVAIADLSARAAEKSMMMSGGCLKKISRLPDRPRS